MTVAMTGATGFVGHHVAVRLLADGHAVRALVRAGSTAGSPDGIEVVPGDLADAAALAALVDGAESVVHLAGLTTRSHATAAAYEAVNVGGTRALAEAAAQAGGRRFVFASTVGVFGRPPCGAALTSSSAVRPNTPYRRSKARAEAVLADVSDRTGLPVATLRLSVVLGPGAGGWAGWCDDLCAGRFRLVGPGDNRIHVVDVADVAEGVARALEAPAVPQVPVVIAGPEAVPMRAFVALWAGALGVAPPVRSPVPSGALSALAALGDVTGRRGLELPMAHRAEFFTADRAFDVTEAGRVLGFRAGIGPDEAVCRTVRGLVEPVATVRAPPLPEPASAR